ncbi:aldo/keto reductase [Peristeroidobacter soli]|uniref:aldo/keto reductase n=1 Tax=Peristeroidobacter soli TaxID=2497877 RepID=UPI00101C42E4|nr:aldo/keto reductase [Peristeroidobacter soli]
MTTQKIARTDLAVSRIAYGCAKLVPLNSAPLDASAISSAERLVQTSIDNGITLFDLADHYGYFKAEEAFGKVLHRSPRLRQRIVIQSKAGVRGQTQPWLPGGYYLDCSREHIVNSVEGSLRRLGTDHLDILLLHYPDALGEPQEIAAAFEDLTASGKVRYFGVSNHTVSQIELLRKVLRQPVVVNQIPLGLALCDVIADGLNGNLADSTRVTGIIDYCRLHDICLQAHSPLQGTFANLPADANPKAKEAARVLARIAAARSTTPWVISLAWLLRHPAAILPIIGSTDAAHITENCAADSVHLDREEWYGLLVSAAAALQS